MKTQILHLDPHDDLPSARDKIGWTQTDRLILVWPTAEADGRRTVRRKLDLVLLHRHAAKLGAKLALVTQDAEVVAEAQAIGVPVFDSVEASQRGLWRYRRPFSINRAFSRRARADEDAAEGYRLPRATQTHASTYGEAPIGERVKRALGLVLFALSVAALVTLAAMVVPAATITLTPASQRVEVTVPVVADPARAVADAGAGLIPARFITVEVKSSAQTVTTGLVETPSNPAQGKVVFTNRLAQAALIPAGTGVRTTGGASVRFATTTAAALPETVGAAVEVPIRAVQAGPEGNVGADLINAVDGPLALQVAVINPSPTGGGQTQPVASVAEADRDRLRAQVLSQIEAQAGAQVASALGAAEFIAPGSAKVIRVLDETFDRFVDEKADTLSLETRALVRAVAVDEGQADTVAFSRLLERIGPGLNLLPDRLAFTRNTALAVDEDGHVSFSVTASGAVAPKMNLEALRTAVVGKPVGQAREYLASQVPLVKPPQITIWPGWFNRVPYLTLRVNLSVETQPGD